MFYVKNLPNGERVFRLVMGLGLIFFGLFYLKTSIPGSLLAIGGGSIALTGLVGFCPMCAMMGRKLDKAKAGN